MSSPATLALRIALAIALAGSVLVQAWLLPLFWNDLDDAPAWARASLVAIVFLGIVAMQVVGVCLWRLLTLVRRGTVFSHASFREVDAIVAAVAAAALLVFAFACVLAQGTVAPGVVLLICGASFVTGGVALVVLVLRALLAQAVALDATVHRLRRELEERAA